MARLDHIRYRLENWARWSVKRESGALGYPSQSAFTRLGVSPGVREVKVPTIELDALEIDNAVQSLQLKRSHLYLTLTLHYAKSLPIHQVASRMGKAVSTVKRNLEMGDQAIDAWLQAKHGRRQD